MTMSLTKEEIESIRERYDIYDLKEVFDSALRLDAIEAAGDEEVEKACEALRRGYWTSEDGDSIRPDKHIDAVLDVVASRNATITDLLAKLGEATERIQDLEDGIEAARLGL